MDREKKPSKCKQIAFHVFLKVTFLVVAKRIDPDNSRSVAWVRTPLASFVQTRTISCFGDFEMK